MRHISYIFRKTGCIFGEMFYLIRAHKLYFITPILIMLALLAFFAFYFGPTAIITFIYAGI